jgi:hypothetical protein
MTRSELWCCVIRRVDIESIPQHVHIDFMSVIGFIHETKGTAAIRVGVVKAVLNCLALTSSLDLWWLTSDGME